MTERTGLIYIISFTYGKYEQYVGQTYTSIEQRMREHKSNFDMLVDRKMRAHPDEYFVTVIEDNIPLDQLNDRERYYIQELGTFYDDGGLNMTTGGQQNSVYSEETRAKISASNTGKVRSEETKRKLSEMQMGRPLTDEWKDNISNGMKKYCEENGVDHLIEIAKKPCKEETKAKISAKMKQYYAEHGTQRLVDMHLGTHHSEEAKKKMSLAKLGKKQDPAVVAKRTESIKEMWKNPEHVQLISGMFTGEGNPFYGKKHDAEAKKKMSEAKLEHWRKLKEKQLAAYLDWEWLMTQGINTQFPIELITQAVKDGR